MKHASIPFFSALLLAGCDPAPTPGSAPEAPLVMVAGMVTLPPTTEAEWTTTIDRVRLGIAPGERVACYELTTPAGQPFAFDVLSRRDGNGGNVMVGLAHAADDGVTPTSGVDSIATAGIVPSATGATQAEPWIQALGDGFSRISVSGAVQREQILAVRADNGEGRLTGLVRVSIGPSSAINIAVNGGASYPGVTDSRTIYSSNSWMFALPVAAVSGDRTTVIAYEGDRADPTRYARYEMRLQMDNQTHAVTGGASHETSVDSGNWRDHEVAALFNTLAVVHCGNYGVDLRLSFDRGATFAQTMELEQALGHTRLCQIAMATDYSLAVTYWRSLAGRSELVLARGAPSAYEPGGSPTWYAMEPLRVIRTVQAEVSPLLMGITWSDGGDLVMGYAFSTTTSIGDGSWRNVTDNCCAVLPWQGTLRDVLVQREEIIGRDPSVSVIGSGDQMRVLFASEGRTGVRLTVSNDAGRTFGLPIEVQDPYASCPSVLGRMQGGHLRVDLLYLTLGQQGQELRLRHWDDFDASPFADYRLTQATRVESASIPVTQPVPGGNPFSQRPSSGMRVTEVAWFGYDAVLDGDDVVVVLDEMTYDAMVFLRGMATGMGRGFFPPSNGSVSGFSAAQPPPLMPGLTGAVPAPNTNHLHQLKVLRLD